MSTKEQVLKLLQQAGSSYISGQEMASTLFVTRASIWKAIKSLQNEGYEIEAITNKGYRLIISDDLPSESLLWSHIDDLNTKELDIISGLSERTSLLLFESVESTNDTARSFAEENPRKECVIISDSQTKGRGRRGREFFSPSKTGIYMSFLLYPDTDISNAMNFTCMMAECTCRAIENTTGIHPNIKWVNDIYYNDKKIAGILTEGISSIEDGSLKYVIIGVGINLYVPYEGFPDDIKKTAGALLSENIKSEKKDLKQIQAHDQNQSEENYYSSLRNRLYSAIIYEFYKSYLLPEKYPFFEGYKSRSMLIGKYVKIVSHQTSAVSPDRIYALVTGINEQCHLKVQYEDGTTDELYSGEVSVLKY